MSDVNPDEEAKIELVRLRLKLLDESPGKKDPGWILVRDIIKLGPCAEPLVAIVLKRYNDGKLSLPDSSLVDMYLAFANPDILELLRRDGRLKSLSVDERCELLKWNVSDVEGSLIEYLLHHWEKRDPWRSRIVEAFAQSGSRDALEALEVIRFDLAGGVPEQLARLPTVDPEEPPPFEVLYEGMEAKADEKFLALVRSTVAKMQRRLESV